MYRHLLNPTDLAVTGLLYGTLLAGVAFLATGAGQGSYLLLGLCSAPLGLTHNIFLALLATPLLWCGLGALLGAETWGGRVVFLATMIVHYASLPLILRDG